VPCIIRSRRFRCVMACRRADRAARCATALMWRTCAPHRPPHRAPRPRRHHNACGTRYTPTGALRTCTPRRCL
jgi:hypothetical protein